MEAPRPCPAPLPRPHLVPYVGPVEGALHKHGAAQPQHIGDVAAHLGGAGGLGARTQEGLSRGGKQHRLRCCWGLRIVLVGQVTLWWHVQGMRASQRERWCGISRRT